VITGHDYGVVNIKDFASVQLGDVNITHIYVQQAILDPLALREATIHGTSALHDSVCPITPPFPTVTRSRPRRRRKRKNKPSDHERRDFTEAASRSISTRAIHRNEWQHDFAQDGYLGREKGLLLSAASNALNSRFESRPTFSPESYFNTTGRDNRVFLWAIASTPSNDCTQEFFVMFAEARRRWKRVKIVARFRNSQDRASVMDVSTVGLLSRGAKLLPFLLHDLFSKLLSEVELRPSYPRLFLHLDRAYNGNIVVEHERMVVVEDSIEVTMCNNKHLIAAFLAIGCAVFTEPSVITTRQIRNCGLYEAFVGAQQFHERKAVFASIATAGKSPNMFRNYCEELKQIIALKGSQGVVKVAGIVLDEQRLELKSCLYEHLVFASSRWLIAITNHESRAISCGLRETWMRQLTSAYSEIHRHGITVGPLSLEDIGFRADGSAVVRRLMSSYEQNVDDNGQILAEYIIDPRPGWTRRKDLARLGYLIWFLAEWRKDLNVWLCIRHACSSPARCTSNHTQTIRMPLIRERQLSYLDAIIQRCRGEGSPAQSVHDALQRRPCIAFDPAEWPQLLEAYSERVFCYTVTCDNCGTVMLEEEFYHCDSCPDFDLCKACMLRGTHCLNREHRLRRRIQRDGELYDRGF